MLVFTNRKVVGTGNSSKYTTSFSPSGTDLSFAHAKKNSQSKWALGHLATDASDQAIIDSLAPIFGSNRSVLLYIHGNNNSPESCFERCALLDKMYGVEVVGFSWPSEGRLPDGSDLPGAHNDDPGNEDELKDVKESNRKENKIVKKARRYRQAKNNAQDSVDALARFLRLMSIARLKTNAQPFSIAAHSLGAHFLQYTLEIESAREALGVAFNVALLAPCVRAAGHKDWLEKVHPKGKVFVTYNEGDSVLFGAYIVDGSQGKLGTDPGASLVQNGIVRYVNFTNSPMEFGGHGYFVYNRLPKKTKKLFSRIFMSLPDIHAGEHPRNVYQLGCDADGVTCYVGAPVNTGQGE